MGEPFDTLSRQIAERSPVEIDDHNYEVWLIAINERTPPNPNAVTVLVGARHGDETYTGEMNIGRHWLAEPDFPTIAIETMKRIVTGALPPGAPHTH